MSAILKPCETRVHVNVLAEEGHGDHLLNKLPAMPLHHSKGFVCKLSINLPLPVQLVVNVHVIDGAVHPNAGLQKEGDVDNSEKLDKSLQGCSHLPVIVQLV